jgi:hypothetical protein
MQQLGLKSSRFCKRMAPDKRKHGPSQSEKTGKTISRLTGLFERKERVLAEHENVDLRRSERPDNNQHTLSRRVTTANGFGVPAVSRDEHVQHVLSQVDRPVDL